MARNDPLSIQFMTEAVRRMQVRRDYIALDYLPMREVSTDELTWDVLRDEQQLAGIYAVNGTILPGDDPIYTQAFADVMRLGASRIIDENTVRILRDPGTVGIETGVLDDYRRRAQAKVAEALVHCRREVDATMEWLGIQALRGYIPWPPPEWGNPPGPRWDGCKFQINYNFPSSHYINVANGVVVQGQTLGGRAYWTDTTNSDPVADLAAVQQLLLDDAGVDTGNMDVILSRRWTYYLMQNATLRDLLKQSEHAPNLMNWAAIDTYVGSVTGWRFRIYDAMFTYRITNNNDPSNIIVRRRRILPDNIVLVVPRNQDIGDFATSPSKPNNWRPGWFTWIEEKSNPWTTEVGVGINAFPRIKQPESIAVLTVAQDATNPPDTPA